MKTRLWIITGTTITLAVIIGLLFLEEPQLQIAKEHYKLEITGLKESYYIGEPYSFSYVLSGFGSSCGGITIIYPENKTNNLSEGSIPSCIKTPPANFVLDAQKQYGKTYGHIGLKEPGNYTVTVKFEKGENGPTVAQKSFQVVDNLIFKIQKNGTEFDVKYKFNGTIKDMSFSDKSNSLLITVDPNDKGNLLLKIPRNLIDAKLDYCPPHMENPPDDRFFVLLDGEEILYNEIQTTQDKRILEIPLLENSTKLEIISTCLI